VLSWLLLLGTVLVPPTSGLEAGVGAAASGLQTGADAPADPTFYAVSYVETTAPSTKTAIAALTRYREESRALEGFIRIEFFEQVGRPGHFAIVEAWRDQKAFDSKSAAPRTQLDAALQLIRVSGYDQRPYKTLTTSPGTGATGRQTVYVIAHVDVTPNPQVPVILRRLADASRKEPGNLRFDIVQHTMRANHFTVVEAWRDRQALDAHVAASHTKQYRDELQPLTGSPLDERVYTIVQ
jgi:quinol monooxygenase YgiN